MKSTIKNKGFTLVEVIVAITLVSMLIAVSMSKFNFGSKISDNTATEMIAALSEIETSYGLYLQDKNASPTGLGDATFVPVYLMIPKVATGFDGAYSTGGFNLAERTGQAAPNNGWYIASRVAVTGVSDTRWNAILNMSSRLPSTKFFYNTTVPAVTNMAAPAGAATVYATYWITRY